MSAFGGILLQNSKFVTTNIFSKCQLHKGSILDSMCT